MRSDFSVDELSQAVAANKVRIALITTLGTLAAVALALALPPVYRADVLAAPVRDRSGPLNALGDSLGGLAELSGLGFAADASGSVAIATLRSRHLTEAFIDEAKLLPILFESSWDPQKHAWKVDADDVPTLWHGYFVFDRDIRRLTVDRKSGLITLSIQWKDPVTAARWANELVDRANEQLQKEAITEGSNTIDYLQAQLAKTNSIEVQKALYRLIEAETKKVSVAHARKEFAFNVIDPAVAPKQKSGPNRRFIVAAGFMAALIAALLSVLVPEALRERR